MTTLDLYPEAADVAEAFDAHEERMERWRQHGSGTLAGWELVMRPKRGGPDVVVRILSDQEDRLPESVAAWQGVGLYGPNDCRTLIVHVPWAEPDAPLRVIYETVGTKGSSTGERVARAVDHLGRYSFLGLRPPPADWYAGLPGPH